MMHDKGIIYAAPRIAAEPNNGVPDSERGQPTSGRPDDAIGGDRRLPAPPASQYHRDNRRQPVPNPSQKITR
jgi:hypothetical protein